MLILLTNDILVIMPIPSVRTNLVDNPSPFINEYIDIHIVMSDL